ncbi:MAG: mycothiol system anti-sigma-R factor [Candidatus Nanopelagicales bacterium]
MSCGNPHQVPCVQVLSMVWVYLDDEVDGENRHEIIHHLEECPPCADQFEAERIIQTRIRRTSVTTATPEGLRTRIVTQIQSSIRGL